MKVWGGSNAKTLDGTGIPLPKPTLFTYRKVGLNDNDSYHDKITYSHDFYSVIINTEIAY